MEQEYNDEQTSTTGATFSTKTMNFGDKALCFEIWDTAGQEKYRALTKMFYKDAGAAILVYDITREVSFEELKNYILQYKGTTKEFITTCYIYYFVDII